MAIAGTVNTNEVKRRLLGEGGFAKAKVERCKGAILSVWGASKTGRTRFALSGKGPIWMVDLDHRVNGTIEQFIAEGKTIYRQKVEIPPANLNFSGDDILASIDVGAYKKASQQVSRALMDIANLPDSEAPTVVIDTADLHWEVLRIAMLGKEKDSQLRYGAINQAYKSLIDRFRGTDKVLVLISRAKEEYKRGISAATGKENASATGKLVRAGFGHMENLVDADIRTAYAAKEHLFTGTLLVSGSRPDLTGTVWTTDVDMLVEDGKPAKGAPLPGDEDNELYLPRVMSDLTGMPMETWEE